MKKLKQLLASYYFTDIQQYFSMITESIINGQRTQAKEQFKALPKEQQKCFIVLIYDRNPDFVLSNEDRAFFMNLL